jgi:hypothetical protein
MLTDTGLESSYKLFIHLDSKFTQITQFLKIVMLSPFFDFEKRRVYSNFIFLEKKEKKVN